MSFARSTTNRLTKDQTKTGHRNGSQESKIPIFKPEVSALKIRTPNPKRHHENDSLSTTSSVLGKKTESFRYQANGRPLSTPKLLNSRQAAVSLGNSTTKENIGESIELQELRPKGILKSSSTALDTNSQKSVLFLDETCSTPIPAERLKTSAQYSVPAEYEEYSKQQVF
jgi:hypothetical protein